MRNLLAPKWMRFASLSLLLSACTPQPPDIYVFEHLAQRLSTDAVTGHIILSSNPVCMKEINEPECGHGVAIMSQKQIFVGEKKLYSKKSWSQLRRESVYLPAIESYAPLATYVINSCEANNCNDQVTRFKVKIDELKSIGTLIK